MGQSDIETRDRWREAGAGIDVIEKRTAKERVHMYAGDAST